MVSFQLYCNSPQEGKVTKNPGDKPFANDILLFHHEIHLKVTETISRW